MTSEVTICNLALSHLGDDATVASINPPEGSPQAQHCARFYPIARDAMLEAHDWNFSTGRTRLVQVENEFPQWKFSYAVPLNYLQIFEVMPPHSTDDYSTDWQYYGIPLQGFYTPQDFCIEVNSKGQEVLLTNQADAVVRYTRRVTDPNQFSNLAVIALSHMLAAMLAGPIIKGKEGADEAVTQAKMAEVYIAQAKSVDSNQRRTTVTQHVPWIAGR